MTVKLMTTRKHTLLIVALYARVSSEKQSQENTIASQLGALLERIAQDGCTVPEDLRFIDDGVSGNTLIRPGLERLRDAVANGALDRLYIYHPDRLSRNYAYQVLLIDEFTRAGVEVIFLNHAGGDSPEEKLLLQMQGMIAEYERTKITERCRRGKRYAARRGSLTVLCHAPYGYRYLAKHTGTPAWEIIAAEAAIVRQIFDWVAHERVSLAEVARRLNHSKTPTRGGRPWNRGTVGGVLKNSAYQGTAYFGKRRNGPRRSRPRPLRGTPEQPRRSYGTYATARAEQEAITVPAIISSDLFAVVQEQLADNRRRWRGQPYNIDFLLRGLAVCARCGYAYVGAHDRRNNYTYYRCAGHSGAGVCGNGVVQAAGLEQAVWKDVSELLRDPERIAREYERRLDRGQAPDPEADRLADTVQKIKRALNRLTDAYEEGLLDKRDFTERLHRNQGRLTQLQEQAQRHAQTQRSEHELRLVIACVEEFRERIHAGLDQADAATRRAVLLALVKRIEIEEHNVRIIYKVTPPASGPTSLLQDCRSCYNTAQGRGAHPGEASRLPPMFLPRSGRTT
jgi:site-specific DNA recombinase